MNRDEVLRRRARVLRRRAEPCPICGGAVPLFTAEDDPDNCRCGGGRSSEWWRAQVLMARQRQKDSWGDVA